MLIFWWIVGGMIAIAILFVLPALLGKSKTAELTQNELNVIIYKNRIKELETEVASGQLAPEQFEIIQQELKNDLGHNLKQQNDTSAQSGIIRVIGILLVIIIIPIFSLGIYNELGTDWHTLKPMPQQAKQPDVNAMIAALAAKLKANPSVEPEGWRLLGKSYMALKRYSEAEQAYAKAYQYIGKDAQVMADYAEAIIVTNQKGFTDKAMMLLNNAKALEPDNDKVNWLLGMAAFRAKQPAVARAYWQKLGVKYPNDQLIQSYLSQVSETDHITDTKLATIKVTVNLDPTIKPLVNNEDVIFILARAETGPRMPLAVVRKQVKDLPVTVTLDDSMAMMPQLKLSAFKTVNVIARLSKSGTAKLQTGDFEVISKAITPNQNTQLTLIIKQQVE